MEDGTGAPPACQFLGKSRNERFTLIVSNSLGARYGMASSTCLASTGFII